MELAGKIITVDRTAYKLASQSQIDSAFAKVTLLRVSSLIVGARHNKRLQPSALGASLKRRG